MSDQPRQYAKKVFLSYASFDSDWKENFTADHLFRNIIGHDSKLEDYKDDINIGSVKDWLKNKIDGAAAVVLFLSEAYISRKYTCFEFWTSLEQQARDRLVFVPVMMDADAVGWWNKQKTAGRLNELKSSDGDSYAFAEFTHHGKPEELFAGGRYNDASSRRIKELALLIKERLDTIARRVGPGPVGPHSILPETSSIVRLEAAAATDGTNASRAIVLLGHATADMPQEVARHRDFLRQKLAAAGLPNELWADRWFAQPAAYRIAAPVLLDREPVFVQPIGPGEGYLAKQPEIHRGWLKKVVGSETPGAAKIDLCRIVLWLPRGLPDEDFDAANPVLPTIKSSDNVPDLVARLGKEIGIQEPLPVIMLESLNENIPLGTHLKREFQKVVAQEVTPPPEDVYNFEGDLEDDLLEQQILLVSGNRAILAIHDLNVGPAKGPDDARQKLDLKLSACMERVRKAQQKAKKDDLKLFWSMLVLRNGPLLPFVQHPSPQFENWHMLQFDSQPKPDPTRSRIFCRHLHDWAARA